MAKRTPIRRGKQLKNRVSPKLKGRLAKLKSLGILQPTGNEGTATLKKKIVRAEREYADQLKPGKNFFIRIPRGKGGKIALDKAKQLGLQTTSKGFFFEKEGAKSAKITVSKTGKARLIIKRKTTGPEGNIRIRTRIVPIDTMDELIRQQDKLRKEAERLGPLKKGESLSFLVTEKGREGFSRNHFSNIDLLINYISQYEKRPSLNTPLKKKLWKNYFFRHIEIIKTTRAETKARIYERDAEKNRAKARRATQRKKLIRSVNNSARFRVKRSVTL